VEDEFREDEEEWSFEAPFVECGAEEEG